MGKRRWTSGILAVIALTAAGCGGGATFANKPRPPTPVNLTVYINNARVSVSPSSVGAGPVVFIVSNAADQTVSLNIGTSDGSSIGTTGPINPQSTAQVTVDFRDPGTYTVSAGKSGQEPGTAEPALVDLLGKAADRQAARERVVSAAPALRRLSPRTVARGQAGNLIS